MQIIFHFIYLVYGKTLDMVIADETSGDLQELLQFQLNCERDTNIKVNKELARQDAQELYAVRNAKFDRYAEFKRNFRHRVKNSFLAFTIQMIIITYLKPYNSLQEEKKEKKMTDFK